MKKSNYAQEKILRERIEQNYEDFKKSTLALDGGEIFNLASEITAVNTAYSYLNAYELNGGAIEYLLNFANPLRAAADEWAEYSEENTDSDFEDMFAELTADGYRYKPVPVAGELREKYGDAIPLETAALLELVELGKRYFNFLDAENFDYSFDGDWEDDDWEIN